MAERLNQVAIDRIFASGGGGDLPVGEPAVQPYNFLRPPLPGKTVMRTVADAGETFVRNLAKLLSVQLRAPVEIEIEATEIAYFSEFAHSLDAPAAAFFFPAGRGSGSLGVLDWSAEVALVLVDRMLGGAGRPTGLRRPLTAIERGVIANLTSRTLETLTGAWSGLLPISSKISGFESTPAKSKRIRPETRVLTILFGWRTPYGTGTVSLGLPYAELEAALESAPAEASDAAATERVSRLLRSSRIKHSNLTLSAQLPPLRLPMRVVSGLREGQIIDTGRSVDAPVHVHLNGRLLYEAGLGRSKGRLGLRITRTVDTPNPDRSVHTKQGRVL